MQQLGWQPGGGATINLRVAPRDFGVPIDLELAHDVRARFVPREDPAHLEKPTDVDWTPTGGGPFPTFKGVLKIGEDEDYGSTIITLSGDYEPPLGIIGRGFDAAIGHRIAEGTADRLLRQIRDGMEL